MRASDGAQDARALPLEHAAVAEDGVGAQDEATVSAQPRGSKNQDPGILVDVAAVSRPGEITSASCSRHQPLSTLTFIEITHA